MSYIDRNLLDGEKVEFRTHLHWSVFLLPIFFAIVMAIVAWFVETGSWSAYAWIPAIVAILPLISAFIKRQSSDFAVTNKRVMMKTGVLSTRSIELLLSKIEAIAVDQTFLGRVFGSGDITITGSGGTREQFHNIQFPLDFRRAVQSVTDSPSTRNVERGPL